MDPLDGSVEYDIAVGQYLTTHCDGATLEKIYNRLYFHLCGGLANRVRWRKGKGQEEQRRWPVDRVIERLGPLWERYDRECRYCARDLIRRDLADLIPGGVAPDEAVERVADGIVRLYEHDAWAEGYPTAEELLAEDDPAEVEPPMLIFDEPDDDVFDPEPGEE